MRLKILSKWPLSIINLAGVIFSLMIIFFPIFNSFGQGSYTKAGSLARLALASTERSDSQTPRNLVDDKPIEFVQNIAPPESANPPVNSQAGSGLPVSLKIPNINVDAAIKYVGLTPLGAMDAPKGPSDVAWFNLGPRPGDNGSAVIAGHYGRWKNGAGSVFDDLNKLSEGDRLYVEDERGVIVSFVVRGSKKYDPKADASDVFSSNDGKPHLNLIACDGVWDKVSKSYPKRLVVFADKVDSTPSTGSGQASSPQE